MRPDEFELSDQWQRLHVHWHCYSLHGEPLRLEDLDRRSPDCVLYTPDAVAEWLYTRYREQAAGLHFRAVADIDERLPPGPHRLDDEYATEPHRLDDLVVLHRGDTIARDFPVSYGRPGPTHHCLCARAVTPGRCTTCAENAPPSCPPARRPE